MLSSAAVIVAGVLLVVGFGFVASRAMRTHTDAPNVPLPQAPAVGEITVPPGAPSQGLIPLTSPSPSSSSSAAPITEVTSTTVPPDPGAIALSGGPAGKVVDLSAQGTRDWVHWGLQSTFSLERDKQGGFAILEGAPTAPRFRDGSTPQRFTWSGGDPVATSGGTTTGIHTCGADHGFSLSVPAGTATRTLRLYVGAIAARGRLDAALTTGKATGSIGFEQHGGSLKTTVLTLRYRAPKDGRLTLKWTTTAVFGGGCGGVALQAATLR
jgi:hypothetical protein